MMRVRGIFPRIAAVCPLASESVSPPVRWTGLTRVSHHPQRMRSMKPASLLGVVALLIPLHEGGSLVAQAAPTAQSATRPLVVLAPGLPAVASFIGFAADVPPVRVPEGFTPLFNGVDLTGWHVSSTARHGNTPDFRVVHGMIIGAQHPLGSGGLLVSDRAYGNFELYMEVKPDWGADGGIFFRTTESGVAYQITVDYRERGSIGRVIGEGGVPTPGGPQPAEAIAAHPGLRTWRRDDWNSIRVRVEGDIPHVTVWINDQLVTDFTDSVNRAVGAMTEGPIALQVHGGTMFWPAGGFSRWRNIGIRELSRP